MLPNLNSELTLFLNICVVHNIIYIYNTPIVGTPLYGFDIGADPIVLDSVNCTGMEPNIFSCQISQLGSVTNTECQDPSRAAGVRCSLAAGFCIDGQTRLVDGPTFNEGRLEVCLDGQWLSVCDAGFNSATAYDVCNSRLLLFGGMYNNQYCLSI